MNNPNARAARSAPSCHRAVLWLAAAALLLVVVLAFFPWDLLRGPLSRAVSERIGRPFEITRHLDLRLGRRLTVQADGVVVGNPAWAREPHLLQAESAELELRWWPLLRGRLDISRLSLQQPVLGLERQADGRRTWVLSPDGRSGEPPRIGSLLVDRGRLSFFAPAEGMDVAVSFGLRAEDAATLPMTFNARGHYRGLPFAAQGRTGGVLQLHDNQTGPFPVELQATAGQTQLKAAGVVMELAPLGSLALEVELEGPSLRELDRLVDAVLPATRAYRIKGQLRKDGQVWRLQDFQGALGRSDIAGELAFDRSGSLARLEGRVQSRRLDFEDLGPLIGASGRDAARQQATRPGKVLPNTALDLGRLSRMNANVSFSAAEVRNARGLPLERLRSQVRLNDGALQLDPLVLGLAGGEMTGRLVLSGEGKDARVALKMDARGLQLNRLFPTIEETRSSLGKGSGFIDLQGQGDSVAQWLGSANGELGFLMGRGQISNILLEFVGLDGGEIIKFLARGDRDIRMHCSAMAFELSQGVMRSRVLLLDTVDTVVHGQGQINLAQESLDLVLAPEPKDPSILSVRSPLRIAGTLAEPEVQPDRTALAGRAGLAIALGLINPLLALAATVETGPGEDADCAQALATVRQAGDAQSGQAQGTRSR